MTTSTTQVFRIYINAPAEKVFAGLTSSELTTRYGYAGPMEMELTAGSDYAQFFGEPQRDADGTPLNAITGRVVEADPPRRLVITWRPFWVEEPESTISYDIEDAAEGGVRLTLTHECPESPVSFKTTSGDAPADAPGQGGWPWVLSALKTLLETDAEVIRPA